MAQSFTGEENTIPIILTHHMTLQDIFDSWYEVSRKASSKTNKKTPSKKKDDGGIFFRDLEPTEYYKGENMCDYVDDE